MFWVMIANHSLLHSTALRLTEPIWLPRHFEANWTQKQHSCKFLHALSGQKLGPKSTKALSSTQDWHPPQSLISLLCKKNGHTCRTRSAATITTSPHPTWHPKSIYLPLPLALLAPSGWPQHIIKRSSTIPNYPSWASLPPSKVSSQNMTQSNMKWVLW